MDATIGDPSDLDYLVGPVEVRGATPTMTRPQVLPLGSLLPRDFERLCFRLVRLMGTVEDQRMYGVPGQDQQGIDLYARRRDGSYVVVQCKRSTDGFNPGEITEAVNRFLDNDWAQRSSVFVLAVTASLEDTKLANRIEAERPRLAASGIEFRVWDEAVISAMLKDHPQLVDDFFGIEAVRVFLGPSAADAISGRPDAAAARPAGEPVARSDYLAQVRLIAPPELLGRDDELAELASFCSQPQGPAYRWMRARAWSGKSALLSWFVLHPPLGVRVVSFFITARLSGQGDRVAFAEVVLEQLADLLSVPMPAYLTGANLDAHLLGFLERAAQACALDGQRLVLIVDGLDEDRGWTPDPDAHSIAALLPSLPPAGIRIVVAGRPNPPLPADVRSDHPLRDPAAVTRLVASPHARVVRHEAERELKRLLRGTEAEQRLLGLVTAAGGGLSGTDLAELTGYEPPQIEDLLHAVSGRTFRSRTGQWRTDTPVYLLGHEELQQFAIRRLGSVRLERYRLRLHEWADRYRANRWPPETPEYLFRAYHRLLQGSGDLTRMIALATDPDRHGRMLDITGGDSVAVAEILSTQEAVLASVDADLATMARLAVHRDALRQRNSNVPIELAGIWAQLGHVSRAEALAHAMADQPRAVQSVARAVAEAGDLDRAERLALSISAPDEHIIALLFTATAAARLGDTGRAHDLFDRAESAADLIPETWRRQQAWMRLAQSSARLGDLARSGALADRAESAVGSLASPFPQQQELSIMAEEMARGGDLDRAERLTLALSEPYEQALTFGRIVGAAAGDGDPNRIRSFIDRAEALLASIADPGVRARGLAQIAKAAAEAGDPERTAVLAMEAATAARSMVELEGRVFVLTWAAAALASAGQGDHASGLVFEAEALAWSIEEEAPRSSALTNVAFAVAQGGNFDRAAEIVESIPVPGSRMSALLGLAHEAARAGEVAGAETLARMFGDPYLRVQTLVTVAAARIRFGQLAEATVLANEIETTARGITNAETQAELSVALSDALTLADDRSRAGLFAAQAETYAQLIALPMTRIPLLAKAARAMVLAGDHQRALALVESVRGQDRLSLISAVMQPMVRAGEYGHAEALVASIAGPYAQVQAVARLAKDLADAGRPDRASVLFRRAEAAMGSIGQPGQLEEARSCLATAMAHVGELDQAETIARAIQDPFTRVQTLVPVAEAAIRAGLPHRGGTLLDDAQQVVGSIEATHLLVQALTTIAAAMIPLGAPASEQIKQLVDRAERAARSADYEMGTQLLASIAVVAARAGDLDRAEKLVLASIEPSWQSHARTIATVAEAMVTVGDPDRAARIAASMGATWRSHMQTRVVKAICAVGDAVAAERLAKSIANPEQQAEALAHVARIASRSAANRLLGQALYCGSWVTSILAVTHLQPDIASLVAGEVALLGYLDQPNKSLVFESIGRPVLGLWN